jgi:hypothetical protein
MRQATRFYARLLGASVKFHGPTMYWDSRPQYNKPAISKAATSWTRPDSTADVNTVIKADIVGFVFRESLTKNPNDQTAIDSDLDSARDWYRQHVSRCDARFHFTVEMARDEISEDLRSPAFRNQAWDTAMEFDQAVFGVEPSRARHGTATDGGGDN